METANSLYNYFFVELGDPKVNGWAFMDNPFQIFAILALYLYEIYIFIPEYMSDKKPYSLKRVIQAYNIFQVVACIILIHGIVTSGWSSGEIQIIGCYPPDYTINERSVRMAKYIWYTMLLKMTELIETLFFALRKKNNQISFLHVYHHVTTLIASWVITKYLADGTTTFSMVINSFIHVLMYTYYFLASLGPEWQRRLSPIKSKLTMLQMIQLTIIVLHTTQVLAPSCGITNWMALSYIPNMTINIIFFANFYLKSYSSKRKA